MTQHIYDKLSILELEVVLSLMPNWLTQPHNAGLYGEGCPPLITTIQTISLCNVGFRTPGKVQTLILNWYGVYFNLGKGAGGYVI